MATTPSAGAPDLPPVDGSAEVAARHAAAVRAATLGATASEPLEGLEPAPAEPLSLERVGWALTGVRRLRERADGLVARALAIGAEAVDAGLALLAEPKRALSPEERAALRQPAGWDSEVLDEPALCAALLPVAAVWSTLAIECGHAARAELLALEAGLSELARRRLGSPSMKKVELLWEQALDHAQQSGSVATALLACARLWETAVGESRSDFAAYLAARLADTAEAVGDSVEGARARLQEARFWEQSGEYEAAWEAAQVGLEDACEANDRSLVTQALLTTGRLASRSGGTAVAEQAFEGALGALSLGADSAALFAHARFGLATLAARRKDWAEALEHLELARQHAVEAGQLPLYARTVLATLDVNERLGRSSASFLTTARRDATAGWGLGAAALFEGLAARHDTSDVPRRN